MHVNFFFISLGNIGYFYGQNTFIYGIFSLTYCIYSLFLKSEFKKVLKVVAISTTQIPREFQLGHLFQFQKRRFGAVSGKKITKPSLAVDHRYISLKNLPLQDLILSAHTHSKKLEYFTSVLLTWKRSSHWLTPSIAVVHF